MEREALKRIGRMLCGLQSSSRVAWFWFNCMLRGVSVKNPVGSWGLSCAGRVVIEKVTSNIELMNGSTQSRRKEVGEAV